MKIQFNSIPKEQSFAKVFLIFDRNFTDIKTLSEVEATYVRKKLEENDLAIINRYNELIIIAFADNLNLGGNFRNNAGKGGMRFPRF
jgi:hypothetical protein